MYTRFLNFADILKSRSLFLFGPRQTGKSTYLKNKYPDSKYINLLKSDEFLEYSTRPQILRHSLTNGDRLVIIDEIQKLPNLLDEVQAIMLDRPDIRFILTGSSARKLKRGRANLLAGRAIIQNFYPLVSSEIAYDRLFDRLDRGSMPHIIDSPIFKDDLKSYVGTYLQEEIQEEGLSRGIENFSRFLEVAGLSNGKQINYTEIGSDAGVAPRTIREYYKILEDTLLGFILPAFQKTIKRKPVATSKFYFFDVGVANYLCKRSGVAESAELYGLALEHLIGIELKAFLDYFRYDLELSYWRSLSQIEVDFIIGEKVAIEVKAKKRIGRRDLKGLLALSEEFPKMRKIIVCNESFYRKEDGIEIIPLKEFLELLWQNKLLLI